MDKKSSKDGDSIPAQLFPQSARVLHVQDLPSHQEDDPKGKVPAGRQEDTPDELGDELGTTGTNVPRDRNHRPTGRELSSPGQEPLSSRTGTICLTVARCAIILSARLCQTRC